MRYLTLAADRFEPEISDENPEDDFDWTAELPSGIREKVRLWNDDYQSIVSMDETARRGARLLVEELDKQGLRLATEIAQALGEVEVRYYSEGTYSYLLP